MAKRTAWLYVGLPHTGGPAVADAAAAQAETLRSLGIDLPAESHEQMRRASAEILRDHKEQGYRRADVEGAWAAVCRRAWRGKRTPLLGHERLAGADEDQIALLLDGLAGLRPSVVLALRDPGTLLVEAWADEIRQGRAPTLARFAERVLDPDAGHQQAERFRAARDVPAVLDRWVGALGPARVHAVVLPPDRDPGESLWRDLLDLLDLAGGAADAPALPGPRPGPPGVTAGTAVQQRANEALKDRLSRAERRDLLGDWLLERGATGSVRPRLPDELLDQVLAQGEKWRARVAESGVDVRGDLEHLVPASPAPTAPAPTGTPTPGGPDASMLEVTARALGEATVEVARLHERVAELEARTVTLERKRSKLKQRVARLGG